MDNAVEMARRIEIWPVEKLVPYERNARTHSEAQISKIAASIAEFGFTNPLLVDGDAGIIAGHGRLMAAKKLGMTEVPVIELAHLNETQKRAYIIADNRLALDAGWDDDMLSFELDALRDAGYSLELTGFTDKELAELIGTPDDPPGAKDKEVEDEKRNLLMVEFDTENELARLYQEMMERGFNCKIME